MTEVTIHHNPACGTARNVRGLIRRMGVPVREVPREDGTSYAEHGLGDPALTDDELLDAMPARPVLIDRPIVVPPLGVKLCRPSESVLPILPGARRGAFAKEDGERVVDERGRRVPGDET